MPTKWLGQQNVLKNYSYGLPVSLASMNEFVFAPSYRDLLWGCCVSIIGLCLFVQFSFNSAAENSECKAHVANSQWQRVPDRRAGSGEAAWSVSRQLTAWNCQIVTGSRTEMLTTSSSCFDSCNSSKIVTLACSWGLLVSVVKIAIAGGVTVLRVVVGLRNN